MRWVAALVAFVTFASPVLAASGTLRAGSTATDIAGTIENGWNAGQWFCKTGSPTLSVWANIGRCAGREVVIGFTVTSGGGVTNVDHTFEYVVQCSGDAGAATIVPEWDGGGGSSGGTIRNAIRFDDGPFVPIDNGVFTFDLTGGDSLELVTTEQLTPSSARAMGRVGVVVASIAFLAGLFCLLRRS